VIIFGLVQFLSKKITKSKKNLKKNQNRVKPTGFGSVWFFREKTGSNRFGSGFPVLARFSRFFMVLARFFSLARFSGLAQFFSVSVRFGFLLIKPKPNRTGWFFQNFNQFKRFFFRFGFFSYFFFGFLGLIGFSVFLLIPTYYQSTH